MPVYTHTVKVIDSDTLEVVKTLKATSLRKAEKLEDSLYLRVNLEKFHIELEEIQ